MGGEPLPPCEHVAIVGSRDFPNMEQVRAYVRALHPSAVIVSGGARGVDSVAVAEAKLRQMHTLVFRADWKNRGKGAGFFRNRTIVEESDRVVAFWDGLSRGTQHTIKLAKAMGKPVEIVRPLGWARPTGKEGRDP